MKQYPRFFSIIFIFALIYFLPTSSFSKNSNSEAPDFAFPETVIANSEVDLANATKKGNEAEIINSCIRLVIANDLISSERMPEMANLLDSIAQTLSPTGSAILYSLEAQLYSEVYQSNSYKYDRRELPTDSYPNNPQDWNKALFAKKVLELVDKSLANKDDLINSPTAEWVSILTNKEQPALDSYPTLFNVIANRSINFLSYFSKTDDSIPFGDKERTGTIFSACDNRINQILSNWLNLAEKSKNVAELAAGVKILNERKNADFSQLLDYYHKYQSCSYATEFLILAGESYPEDFKQKREFISIAEKCCELHSGYFRINRLKNLITDYSSGSINAKVSQDINPSQDVIITVCSEQIPANSYLCLYKLPSKKVSYNNWRELLKKSGSRLITAKSFKSSLETQDTTVLNFGQLPVGRYAIVASPTSKGNVNELYDGFASFNVTDFILSEIISRDRNKSYVQVLSSINGAPIKNKKVKFSTGNELLKSKSAYSISDIFGLAEVPEVIPQGHIKASLSNGNDEREVWFFYNKNSSSKEDVSKTGVIFTSLAIYHPGDTCEFSVVLYSTNQAEGIAETLPNHNITVSLRNTNYETVETLSLTTDKDGRASSSFILPKNGVTGKYSICVNSSKRECIGTTNIVVEEYKQPTFYVELDDIPNIIAGKELKIQGSVRTYTNMPVSSAKVEIKIDTLPAWWRAYSTYSYAEQIETDSNGDFSLSLNTERLKGDKEFENHVYTVVATTTSAAGETQSSDRKTFYIGSQLHIRYIGKEDKIDGNILKMNGDEKFLSFPFEITGGNGERQSLNYKVINSNNDIVLNGESDNSTVKIESAKLNSGVYNLVVFAGDAEEKCKFVVFRCSDEVPPFSSPLWSPETNMIIVPEGQDYYNLKVGSTSSNYIFYMVYSDKVIIDKGFVHPSGSIINLKVKAPTKCNSDCWVTLATVDSCRSYKQELVLMPEISTTNIEREIISFRDKINAGYKEYWKFRYVLDKEPVSSIPVIATLSNKSLNAISPFNWIQPRFSKQLPGVYYSFYRNGDNEVNAYISKSYHSFLNSPNFETPDFYTYGMNLYSGRRMSLRYKIRGTMTGGVTNDMAYMEDGGAVLYDSVQANGVMLNSVAMATADAPAANPTANYKTASYKEAIEEEAEAIDSGANEVMYRPAEMPLAWFKPNLRTDKDGVLEISFDVPNYNTTWQLQMLAYNKEMLSNLMVQDVIATKPVMVSVNSPRFLRTSDHVNLMATVFNNSGNRADVSAQMEIFNPIDNSILLSKEFKAESVDSAGSRLISMDFIVPDNVEFVGYRVAGKISGFSDGEQNLIAILPASSPVTESYPFYIAPDQHSYSLKLPKFDKDASVNLQYCDNPVWECVTALPDMSFETNASILSTANSLYGNIIAYGLCQQYPEIGKAITEWKATSDSTLVSPLQKNEELKIISLQNTPWTLNAQSETLRMSRLSNLLDTVQSDKAISQAIESLKKAQSGGGWSWCPGMKPSMYITGQILWRLGMLWQMGYYKSYHQLKSIANDALQYCDAELYKEYLESKKRFSTTTMLSYLYIRSFFKEMPMSENFKQLKAQALKAIKNEWKQFSIYNKATAAILLFREKEPMLARTILESLNQYASKSAERGMWFDNLRSGMFTENTLITTAQALEAYTEITPDATAVDLLRQWLVIERQAQDWGTDAQLAEVIHAILTSGTDWTHVSKPAEIYIDNQHIDTTNVSAYTGRTVIPLDASLASKAELRIKTFGTHPSWGGVIAKYISPTEDVKVFSECDATITKTILVVDESENGTSVHELKDGESVKLGQHLRVQLKVAASRDMDYVVIKDERGGCLAPKDQLSGYCWQDGIGYYREIRNDATNFFLSRLPRGNFYVEYDCYADRQGEYSVGIASLQSLYAPTQSAHSAGLSITVK